MVKAGEEVDLCPDAGFVSLYVFILDDFEGNMTGWMDKPDGVLVESERDEVILKRHLDGRVRVITSGQAKLKW